MTTAHNLAVVDGQTFHKQLYRNSLIDSSEAASKDYSSLTKRATNPGLPASCTRRLLERPMQSGVEKRQLRRECLATEAQNGERRSDIRTEFRDRPEMSVEIFCLQLLQY